MAENWTHRQLKILKHYPEKGGHWVLAECNKVEGAPKRTLLGVRRKARKLGYSAQAEPLATSEQIDLAIRQAYQGAEPGAVKRVAAACNRPVWWVIKRAKQLELRPLRGRPLTEREMGCIKANAHLPVGEIQAKLQAFHSKRSAQTILDYINRSMIQPNRDRPLSATALAELFGVNPSTLTKHIYAGRLIARRSGTGGPKMPAHYLIEGVEVVRFVIKHPQLVDLRKVDQVWFIDLMAHHAADAMRDMHRNQGVRLAQMMRENPDISPEVVAGMLGVSESEAKKRLAEARRETMREAA